MENKILEIINNINLAINSEENSKEKAEATDFLNRTEVLVPFGTKEGQRITLANREGVGLVIPVYLSESPNEKNLTFKSLPVLGLLVFLSKSSDIKGLVFVKNSQIVKQIIVNRN